MEYLYHTLVMALIFSLLSLSLNIQLGYTGLYNLGHVAFYGLGAYAAALLGLAGAPMALGLAAAMAVAGLAGLALAFPALRLRGDFFGIATLAFGEMVRLALLNEAWLTKGPMGLPGIPRPEILGSTAAFILGSLILTAAALALLASVHRSPFGRALKVVREDEYVAQALGKNALSFKVRAMVAGACLAGLAGGLWAHYITYISPYDFSLQTTILILLCVVLGGKGTTWGPVLGAFLVIFFQETLRFLPLPPGWTRLIAPTQGMVFGLVLIVLMRQRPQGVIAETRRRACSS
jgi:branched-chain amino acid transport system permease protein